MPKVKAKAEAKERAAAPVQLNQDNAIADKMSNPQRLALMPMKDPFSEEGAVGRTCKPEHAITMRRIQRAVGNTFAVRFAVSPAPSSTTPTKHLIQSKLTIGQPDHMYEREADAAASRISAGRPVDQVSRMTSGGFHLKMNQQQEASDLGTVTRAQPFRPGCQDQGLFQHLHGRTDVSRTPDLVGTAAIQRRPEPRPAIPVIVPRFLLGVVGQRIGRALDRLERYAGAGTFAPWIVPVLRRLASNLTYRDQNGQSHGGTELEVGFQGRRQPFFLRLVVDDQLQPHSQGYFEPDGNRGRIGLNRRPPSHGGSAAPGTRATGQSTLMVMSEEDLAQLLYHESIHMFRYWLRHIGAGHLPFSSTERRILSMASFQRPTAEVPRIEQNLRTLISDVNRARAAVGAAPVATTVARGYAESLGEEALVRGETLYMQRLSGRREARAQGRAIEMGLEEDAGRSFGEEAADYLFESGNMLTRQDRTALNREGQVAFDRIRRLLGEIAHLHVRNRWGARPTETRVMGVR